ncbi:MAG: hypothetical protein MK196_09480 [Acidimicrobiales bacterium]|nr:hypothetical protein [Acidimicrobiales bacterium]
MRRSCTSPTALISGSFFSEEATAVDAPAPGISVAVVGTVVVAGTSVVVVVGAVVGVVVGTAVVGVVVGTAVVGVVVGTAVVVVAGTAVVGGPSLELRESGASLLHVTAVAYIETTPRQTTTFVDR